MNGGGGGGHGFPTSPNEKKIIILIKNTVNHGLENIARVTTIVLQGVSFIFPSLLRATFRTTIFPFQLPIQMRFGVNGRQPVKVSNSLGRPTDPAADTPDRGVKYL